MLWVAGIQRRNVSEAVIKISFVQLYFYKQQSFYLFLPDITMLYLTVSCLLGFRENYFLAELLENPCCMGYVSLWIQQIIYCKLVIWNMCQTNKMN